MSGHAELLAIRRAQTQLQTDDLSGYTIYASGEPCPMCLTAMYFVGIDKVYYSGSVEDANKAGLGKSKKIYEDLRKKKDERGLTMIQLPLEKNQTDPMKRWADQ